MNEAADLATALENIAARLCSAAEDPFDEVDVARVERAAVLLRRLDAVESREALIYACNAAAALATSPTPGDSNG